MSQVQPIMRLSMYSQWAHTQTHIQHIQMCTHSWLHRSIQTETHRTHASTNSPTASSSVLLWLIRMKVHISGKYTHIYNADPSSILAQTPGLLSFWPLDPWYLPLLVPGRRSCWGCSPTPAAGPDPSLRHTHKPFTHIHRCVYKQVSLLISRPHGLFSTWPGSPGPFSSQLLQSSHSQKHTHTWLPNHFTYSLTSLAWCSLVITCWHKLSVQLLAPHMHGPQRPWSPLQLLHLDHQANTWNRE